MEPGIYKEAAMNLPELVLVKQLIKHFPTLLFLKTIQR